MHALPTLGLWSLFAASLALLPAALSAGEAPREPLRPVSAGEAGRLAQVVWTGAQFVAVGGDGSIASSENGEKWSNRAFLPGAAKIYYTEDGSEPSSASTPYAGPSTPVRASIIKARAYVGGQAPSEAAAARFGPAAGEGAPPPTGGN